MANVSFTLARWIVVVLLCLAGATNAFAQGGTGTLTGTVVDGTGAALPGATVNATEANTGTVRTVVSDEAGLFRMAALNPGRYSSPSSSPASGPLNVADINLLSTEVRDLGKLALEIGGITETVSITSEVTPVQVADSSRRIARSRMDDIANIQTKGRDIFGLLGILPGVQDTNLNRDFAQWRSAISITINGMPSQNKDVRVDGINIVDEGGCGTAYVNLNMDAIGEVQVIANGYTAENGRNNGGVISMVTKSGTNAAAGVGLVQRPPRQVQRERLFPQGDAGQAKPLYRVNISGYSVGGPVVIPGLIDSRERQAGKKFYFFGSQEYTDDARPTTTTRANMPTALEYNGDFSQTRITNGTIQPIIDPLTGQQFPGNRIPAAGTPDAACSSAASTRSVRGCCGMLPEANGILEPARRSAVDVELGVRPDAGARPHEPRAAHRRGVHREDPHGVRARQGPRRRLELEPSHAGHRLRQPEHARPADRRRRSRRCSADRSSTRSSFGYTHNRWGFKAADDFDYTSLYRSTLGVDPPRFEPFGGLLGSAAARRVRRIAGGRVAVRAAIQPRPAATANRRTGVAIGTSVSRRADSPPEPERPVLLQRRPVDDDGAPQLQDGSCRSSTTARPSRARPTTWATSISATTRTTRSAPATATPTCCSACSRPTPS